MATITAAAGGGAWTVGTTWVGNIAPTAADDALLTAASGNVTVDTGAVCRSLDCNTYTGTLTHTAAVTLTIGDGTAGAGNIALRLVAGMTYTLGSATTSAISFVSSSGTLQTITWAGKVPGNVTMNGSGGKWQFQDGYTASSTTLAISQGTFDANGKTINLSIFNSNSAAVRVVTLGAASITCSGSGTPFNFGGTLGNLTFTANTGTFTASNGGGIFQGGANFNGLTLVLNTTSSSVRVTGINTFGALTIAGGVASGAACNFDPGTTTITGALTFTSNSVTNRLHLSCQTLGSTATLSAGSLVCTNAINFADITGSGAATWTTGASGATYFGDGLGNSGITFTTSATQTWSGTSGGTWAGNAWSSRMPLPQDDVVINAAFAAGQTIDTGQFWLGRNISWAGATGAPTWNFSTQNVIFGSVVLIAGMILSGTNVLTLAGRSSFTLTNAGLTYAQSVNLNAFGGTYTQQDTFSSAGALTINNGSWVANNQNVNIFNLVSSATTTRSLDMGNGTWNISQTGALNIVNMVSTGMTFSGASATIVVSSISTNTRTFIGGGLSYGTLTYTIAGSTGTLVVTGSNTFGTLNFSDITNARILQFTAGTTTTITGSFNVHGTAGKLMSIQSVTAATHTLAKATGTVPSDYLNLTNSLAGGGAAWYAGANSTDNGGNTGWIFTAPPTPPVVGDAGDGGYFERRTAFAYRSVAGISPGTPNDVWMQYLRAVTGSGVSSPNDLERVFLRQKGGSGDTYYDLWTTYLQSKGYSSGSLHDNQMAFFTSGTQT